nr:IS5 family transposase [Deinococcus humi]
MVERWVPDGLWTLIFPMIPEPPPRPKGGRPHLHPRRVLAGILYILRWGLPWRQLPTALGFGSGITCERAFHRWQAQGLWSSLFQQVLNHAAAAGQLDWSRAALDGCSLPAPRGGEQTGRNPTDRGKLGSKLHLLIDASGLPLAITLTGANVHDSRQLEATLDAVHGVRTGEGCGKLLG